MTREIGQPLRLPEIPLWKRLIIFMIGLPPVETDGFSKYSPLIQPSIKASHGIDLSAALSYNRLLCGANGEECLFLLNEKLWLSASISQNRAYPANERLAPFPPFGRINALFGNIFRGVSHDRRLKTSYV